MTRILPYRTAENVINGLVITFVDVTKIKTLQESELFEPDEAERLSTLERQVLDSGSGMRQQISLKIKGQARRFDLYLEPMRAEGGAIIGVTGVATDIT